MSVIDRLLDRLFPAPPPSPAPAEPPAPPAPESDDLDPEAPISGGARNPPGVNMDSYVERQIQEAQRRGRFDNLPLKGKPLPDLDPHDGAWWIRRKLRDEGVEMPLPPSLELRRDLPRELERIAAIADDTIARREIERLNDRIRSVNARHVQGPASNVAPVDVEAFLARRR